MINNLFTITNEINNIYDALILLEQNKDNNYSLNKNILLNKLTILILKENDIYNNFKDYKETILTVQELANYCLSHNVDIFVYNRIFMKLKDISLNLGFNNNIFLDELKNTLYYKYLKSKNLTDEEIFTFLKKYIPKLNDAINTQFIIKANEYLSLDDNIDIIKIKYERAFINSGFIERNLIATNFTNIYDNYKDFTMDNYGIDINIENNFLNMIMIDKTDEIIKKFINNDYDIRDIIQFASNILFLDEEYIRELNTQISNLISINNELKSCLLEYINNILDIYKEIDNNYYKN